jgi:16S rRNA (guanine527-N7)-methyltransferase
VWERHIADSLQLAGLAEGTVWADLGTGAGLPGLVLAIARPELHVHLVESDGRKCAFLRQAARLTGAKATIWDGRIEAMLPRIEPRPDVVVSRALAALPKLLGLAAPVLTKGTTGLFPKGRGYEAELTDALRSWRFTCDILPSRTDPEGRILRVSDLQAIGPDEIRAAT